ncbi:MAG TPA: class I SAM-dependent methyltransferase [Stellaceae bacterium]|jgi:ubiquinone/menaquinone biosynthesis C-methylase UbiE
MPTVAENKYWNTYAWPLDGDEWSDQAAACGAPYAVWKQSLVDAFIAPHIDANAAVLEIAPGHGRWTPYLAMTARRYIGVDMNSSCIAYCRKRFTRFSNAAFYSNDGRSLPMVFRESINYIWSFDSFVHIDRATTDRYMAAFARILVHGGRACIHHPGHPDATQRTRAWRSDVTTESFAALATRHGLHLLAQTDSWGPDGRFHARLYGDCISLLEKP